jgi:putative transposase
MEPAVRDRLRPQAAPSPPEAGDTWHLDEVFLESTACCTTSGVRWTRHGVVLDILVQDRRNASAAKRFFKRLLARLQYKPRTIVTDGLRSYGAARREVLPDVRHRTRPISQQQSRKLAPANAPARAPDAALQVA